MKKQKLSPEEKRELSREKRAWREMMAKLKRKNALITE
jgi:hypothetical protein